MSEQVQTNGFVVPPIPAAQQASIAPSQAPQPTGLQALVPPQQTPQQAEPQQPQQPQQNQNPDLLALLQGFLQQPQQEQQAPQQQEVFDESEISEMSENDPLANSMLSVLGAAAPGLDIDRLLSKALTQNDVGLIDVAYLQEKYPQNAQQLLTIARGLVEHAKTQGERRQNAIFQTAGGKEQWAAAAAAFKQSAPAALKQIAQVLFEQGNDTAGAQLVLGFAQQAGAVVQPGQFLQGGGAAPAGQALSKAEFQAALQKLNPNAEGFEQKRAELFQRRQLGKQLGR